MGQTQPSGVTWFPDLGEEHPTAPTNRGGVPSSLLRSIVESPGALVKGFPRKGAVGLRPRLAPGPGPMPAAHRRGESVGTESTDPGPSTTSTIHLEHRDTASTFLPGTWG